MKQKQAKRHPRGVVALEAAIVLPLLILLILAGLQYGWLFLKQQEITNVARHYVRYATRPEVTDFIALEDAMKDELAALGLSGVDIDDPGTRVAWLDSAFTDVGDPLYVQVSLNTAEVDIIGFLPAPGKLRAHATMSKEGE